MTDMSEVNAMTTDGDSGHRIQEVRLRLLDVASDLSPMPTPAELAERLQFVSRALESIQCDLRLIAHVVEIESGPALSELDELEKKMAEGWEPQGTPGDEAVKRLRSRYLHTPA